MMINHDSRSRITKSRLLRDFSVTGTIEKSDKCEDALNPDSGNVAWRKH
jgi:hypothetical protein